MKDEEWLQIFYRFPFWSFDERLYICRQKLNISGVFQTFFFFTWYFFV